MSHIQKEITVEACDTILSREWSNGLTEALRATRDLGSMRRHLVPIANSILHRTKDSPRMNSKYFDLSEMLTDISHGILPRRTFLNRNTKEHIIYRFFMSDNTIVQIGIERPGWGITKYGEFLTGRQISLLSSGEDDYRYPLEKLFLRPPFWHRLIHGC